MNIRYASEQDRAFLVSNDKWICSGTIQKKIIDKQILVAQDKENLIGWLRYGLFWDNVPFMYMLHLLDEYQGKGLGRTLVEYWENEMKRKGHKVVLTSTAQTEYAQHFYVKLGYRSIGSFQLSDEPLEIIFSKSL